MAGIFTYSQCGDQVYPLTITRYKFYRLFRSKAGPILRNKVFYKIKKCKNYPSFVQLISHTVTELLVFGTARLASNPPYSALRYGLQASFD